MISMVVAVALAATPGTIPVQGILTSGDTVATGARSATFTLLGSNCSASRWSETQTIQLDGGVFSAMLGSVTDLDLELFSEADLCLAVQVDGGVPTAPVPLGTTPYAAHALDAARLGGVDADQYVQRTETRPWSSLNLADAPDGIRLGYAAGSGITLNGRTIATNLAAVAASGSYSDLTNQPTYAAVASSGSYLDLSNRPTYAAVATSGAYGDLTGRPTTMAPSAGSPFYLSSSGGALTGALSVSGALSTTGAVGVGVASPAATLDVGGTGAIKLPVGTTGERPSAPVAGMMRFNTTTGSIEFYNGTNWGRVGASFNATGGNVTTAGGFRIHTFLASGTFSVTGSGGTVDVLVVGGGGGGGGRSGGGGGGGGVIYTAGYNVTAGQTIAVTVGGGGAGGSGDGSGNAANGGNSVFGAITALGGGYGATDADYDGNVGGCGGGGKYGTAGSAGTAGQGFRGGFGFNNPYAGGGGGGAGGVGVDGTSGGEIGDGGPGFQSSISGNANFYGGGGGGGGHNPANGRGFGGVGGGGDGGAPGAKNGGGAGGTNTGGGGGAGTTDSGSGGAGGNGGSGIVIVRYPIEGA